MKPPATLHMSLAQLRRANMLKDHGVQLKIKKAKALGFTDEVLAGAHRGDVDQAAEEYGRPDATYLINGNRYFLAATDDEGVTFRLATSTWTP